MTPWPPGGATDYHVHLELVDPALVAAGGLTRVVDLGSSAPVEVPGVEVIRAGRMLTAPGGYPSDRSWATGGLFREVAAGEAEAAVREQVADGAALVKVALNADAGPVLDDTVLRALVAAAHDAGRKVIAHVEGTGQAARAAEAGVDAFAHAPWTERLPDALIAHLAARVTWISTLRIHTGTDRERAIDNVRRFREAGGRIRYGTDMGNGHSSGGLEQDELDALAEAGLTREELAAALA